MKKACPAASQQQQQGALPDSIFIFYALLFHMWFIDIFPLSQVMI